MSQRPIPAPEADEFAPFYAGYIARVRGADIRPLLERQVPALRGACTSLSDPDALHRYAAGKWSIKEVIGHLADAERVFAYRALCIGRGDETPLPGFDENDYVAAGDFDRRALADLLQDMTVARASTIRLLDSVGPDRWVRRGNANGSEISLRAIAYIIAGHFEHHLGLLADRYGLGLAPAAAE